MALFDWLFDADLPPTDWAAREVAEDISAVHRALDGPYGDNATLFDTTERLVKAANLPDATTFAKRTMLRVVDRCDETITPYPHFNIAVQMAAAVAGLYAAERLDDMPPNPAQYATYGATKALGAMRDLLIYQQRKVARPHVTIEALHCAFVESMFRITSQLPALAHGNPDGDTIGDDIPTIPLIDLLPNVAEIIEDALAPFGSPEARDIGLFRWLHKQLQLNVERIHQSRRIAPSDFKGSPRETVVAYLGGTPLERTFLESRIPFEVSIARRLEHTAIVAGTGWGKTQLLQSMIASDLEAEDPPSMVVIDSTGAMVKRIEGLAVFNDRLRDRILIINPEDNPVPALNPFDLTSARLGGYTPEQRERAEGELIELFNYVFSTVKNPLTARMGTAFTFMVRLLLSIDRANIHTLLELLDDAPRRGDYEQAKFKQHIDKLDPTTQHFFKSQYYKDTADGLREQVRARVFDILKVPAFERMFSSVNRLDFFTEMNRGAIILVNTSQNLLKDGSVTFGRYIIARVMAAAFERAPIEPDKRKPTFLIVDEAAPYFDETFDTLLTRARQYKLGVVIAFQHLEQAGDKLRSSIASNTAVKYAGRLGYIDSRWLSREMGTAPESLMALRLDGSTKPRYSQFACSVRNYTDKAVALTVPFYTLENMPKMSDKEHIALLVRNRARVAHTPAEAAPERAPPSPPFSPPTSSPVASSPPARDPDAGIHTEGAPEWE